MKFKTGDILCHNNNNQYILLIKQSNFNYVQLYNQEDRETVFEILILYSDIKKYTLFYNRCFLPVPQSWKKVA